MIQKLIDLRNKIKAKKPTFIRHDAHKKKRVGTSWRRPKGRQSKMRLNIKGYAKARSTGYSSPADVKGLSRNGLTQNIVSNMKDFNTLNNVNDGIIIAKTVGMKKKLTLVDYAIKNNFQILNFDVEKFNKAYTQMVENKKKQRASFSKKKALKETKEKAKTKTKEKQKTTEKIKTEEQKTVVEDNK